MYEDTLQSYTEGKHPSISLREQTYIGSPSYPRACLLFPYTAGMESRGISLIRKRIKVQSHLHSTTRTSSTENTTGTSYI